MKLKIQRFAVLATLSLALNIRAQFVVNNLADASVGVGNAGSLRYVINQANASGSAATITFSVGGGGTIFLSSMLPILTNPNGISIDGSNSGLGAITIDGGSSSAGTGDRIFFLGVNGPDGPGVAATTSTAWSISNLTLQNGNGRGGNGGKGGLDSGSLPYSGGGGGAGLGGAIFVNAGSLTLSSVTFLNNKAIGGAGGDLSGPEAATGAGGGLGGDGATGGFFNAGGGGGFGLGAVGGTVSGAGGVGVFTGGLPGGDGFGATAGVGGPNGGGGGGSSNNQNAGGGGPGGGDAPVTGAAGSGGFGGGGGGGGGNTAQPGGAGGYGGGGGGAGTSVGGVGGFGGGGGAGAAGGAGGFGAGAGAAGYEGGGGGAGLGGALFIRSGASVTMNGSTFSGGVVAGGLGAVGGGAGQGIGTAAFLAGAVTYFVDGGNSVTIGDTFGGGTDAQITGGLIKTGGGTLTLSGANTYVGPTAINTGTLDVSGSLAVASTVAVASGATLRGSGTVGGSTIVNGRLEAGNPTAISTLTTGSETWNPGGALGVTYDPTAPNPVAGVNNGLISSAGNLNLSALSPGGTFTLDFVSIGGTSSGAIVSYSIAAFAAGTTVLPGGADPANLTSFFQVTGSHSGAPTVSLSTSGGSDFLVVTFDAPFYAEVSGACNPFTSIDVGLAANPRLVDINADGVMDAFIGNQDGTITYFQNVGDPVNPVLSSAVSNPLNGVDVGGSAAPFFVDIDTDGDFDVFVGSSDTTIHFFRNTGDLFSPSFVEDVAGNPLTGISISLPIPVFVDIDGDGDMDLFIGGGDGLIRFYRNVGGTTNPLFSSENGPGNPFDGVNVGQSAAPAFADIDGDGDLDAILGSQVGTLRFFENAGSASSPVFTERIGAVNPFNGLDLGDTSVPVFGNLDGDADLDGFIGNLDGTVNAIRAGPGAPALSEPSVMVGGGYTEGGPPIAFNEGDGHLSIGDCDSLNLAGATVSVNFHPGDVLNFIDQNGITGVFDTATGVLTLSGVSSVANYEIALRSVTFSSGDDPTLFGTANTRFVQTTVVDDTSLTAATQHGFFLFGVNDPPAISAPPTLNVAEDTPSPLTGFSFTDPDAGENSVQVTLSVDSGSLAAVDGAGVVVGGSGLGTVTLSGMIANINAFIGGSQLSFTTAPESLANVNLSLWINDGGNTGSGGNLQASAGVTLIVTPINHPPVAGTDSLVRLPGKSAKISVAELLLNDTDVEDAVLAVSLPGSLSANGATVTEEGSWIIYSPNGSDLADSFQYTVRDPSGNIGIGTVNVTVQPDNSQGPNILRAIQDGADRVIDFAGVPGESYQIQYATTLPSSSWQNIATVSAGADGLFQYRDVAPADPVRFYRAFRP